MAKKLKKADFLKDMAALAADLRRVAEAASDGFDPDPAASAGRRKRAQGDFRFFCETYFPHHVRGDPSGFHVWLWEALPRLIDGPKGQRLVLAAPRGNAKTTYGQLFILWCIVTRRKRFPVILSDTSDQAAAVLEGVKAELEANRRLAQDFPEHCGAGAVWQVGVVVTKAGAKLQAFGSGKRLRGVRHGSQRPDLVWCDDLENDENVRTPAQRDKLESWLDKAVEPLGPPDGSMDMVYVGTVLHYDAVLARKLRHPLWRSKTFRAVIRWPDRMDLWERWEEVLRAPVEDGAAETGEDRADAFYAVNRAEMDRGVQVLWPSVQPFGALMKLRIRQGVAAFDCEFQNDPISSDDAPFGKVVFWVSRLDTWIFFGACDPSLGKANKGRDPSALLVGGYDREKGILDVVEARIARRVPDKIISDVIALQEEYGCIRWAVEAVQFQEFFRTELVARSAKMGVPVPAVPVVPHNDKDLRIESLQPHVANGLIRFNSAQTVLLDQLRHWPKADHDDGPDALEMLWKLALGGGPSAGATVPPARSRQRSGLGALGLGRIKLFGRG